MEKEGNYFQEYSLLDLGDIFAGSKYKNYPLLTQIMKGAYQYFDSIKPRIYLFEQETSLEIIGATGLSKLKTISVVTTVEPSHLDRKNLLPLQRRSTKLRLLHNAFDRTMAIREQMINRGLKSVTVLINDLARRVNATEDFEYNRSNIQPLPSKAHGLLSVTQGKSTIDIIGNSVENSLELLSKHPGWEESLEHQIDKLFYL